MAITSYGYPGTIIPGSVWSRVQEVLGRHRVTPGKNDWQPSINGSATRTVRFSAGSVGSSGILDESDENIDVALPSVGSGSQYFLVGPNRVWGTTNATEADYVAGTSARAIPAFTDDPGVESFQPLALARVTAGNPAITDLVDLRAIAEEPGVYTIFDNLALQLIARPGVTAFNTNTGITYRRVYVGSSWIWDIVSKPIAEYTNFGSSVSGWATGASTGTGSYVVVDGSSVSLHLASRTSKLIESDSRGHMVDEPLFTLDSPYRPRHTRTAACTIYGGNSNTSNATFMGLVQIYESGGISLVAMSPNIQLRRESGEVSLRLGVDYMV